MAKKVKIELNLAGLNEVMKSEGTQQLLEKLGADVAGRAGTGYSSRVHLADYVAICNVYAETKEAKRDNLKNNTLLKAVGR